MNTKTLAATVSTCLVGLALASAAQASPATDRWQVRGDGASVSASSADDCGYTDLYVQAADSVARIGTSQPVDTSGAWIAYSTFDWCKGRETYGWGFVADTGFNSSMSSASLQGTIQVDSYGWVETPDGYWDYVFLGSEPLTVNARWTGTGEAYSSTESRMIRIGRTHLRQRSMGQYRPADVVVSTTLGGSTVNFPSAYGELSSFRSGESTVIHQ